MTMLPEHRAALEALQARLTAAPAVDPAPPAAVVCRKVRVGYPGDQSAVEVMMPTPDAVHATLRAAEQQAALEARPELGRPAASGRSTASLIRERAAEEQAALERFVEVIAELFNCPALVCDAGRSKLRVAFAEARQMARHFGASGEVAAPRGADPAGPARDAAGRFAKAG